MFSFGFSFCFWLNNNFCYMKRSRLINHFLLFACLFACLFVRLFCFLSWNFRVTIHNLIAFLQFPKFYSFFCYFNIILRFILSFTILSCTLFYYEFILTHFMAVTSKQKHFCNTVPWFFLRKVHCHWPWSLLRMDSCVLGDILHSLMSSILFL